jgi:hypothetical protein
MTMACERPEDLDTEAAGTLHLDNCRVLAAQLGAGARHLACCDRQGPEQHAQGVQVMDKHLGHEHSRFPAHEGLAFESWEVPVRVRQGATCHNGEPRREGPADHIGPQPIRSHAIVGPEAPVLVHHEAYPAVDLCRENLCFRQSRSEWLLAQRGQPVTCSKPYEFGMCAAWCRNVDNVDSALGQHLGCIRIKAGNTELSTPCFAIFERRVSDSHDRRPTV